MIQNVSDLGEKAMELIKQLHFAHKELKDLSEQSVKAECRYKEVYSKALLQSKETNAESRKADATLKSLTESQESRIMEFRRHNCVEWIDTLKKEMSALQSIAAGLRSEMEMSSHG